MDLRCSRFWRHSVLCVVALLSSQALGLSEGSVERLRQSCEAAREEALEPIRARRAQACIDQQLRSEDHCKRYYSTYGNVTPGPSGAPQPGLFYDLPECREWLEAREWLGQRHSRP